MTTIPGRHGPYLEQIIATFHAKVLKTCGGNRVLAQRLLREGRDELAALFFQQFALRLREWASTDPNPETARQDLRLADGLAAAAEKLEQRT